MTYTKQLLSQTDVEKVENREEAEIEENIMISNIEDEDIQGLLLLCEGLNKLCEKLSRLESVLTRKKNETRITGKYIK